MRNSTSTRPAHRRMSWRTALTAALLIGIAPALGACGKQAAAGGAGPATSSPAPFVWGPASDGGYACLRDTGGASGQCNAAMGLSPAAPATRFGETP
jgi:hypothetical protein